MKTQIILGVIILFFVLTFGPAPQAVKESRLSSLPSSGFVFFVGGSGPNNYTTIQEAINHAASGDTVFVFSLSSPYFEHVIVNRSLLLQGENATNTVIDGSGNGDVVEITAANVTIQGFTIQHSGDTPKVDAGIEVRSNQIIIQGNIIFQNGRYGVGILLNMSSQTMICNNLIAENGNEGIFLERSANTLVMNNIITHNGHCAVVISQSSNNNIIQNDMYENYAGVSLWPGATENIISENLIRNQEYSGIGMWPGSGNNSIYHNELSNNSLYGLLLTTTTGNHIAYNEIIGSNEGMHLSMANRTIIQYNNFIDNNRNAYFENSSLNQWKQNYWDDHSGSWPKIIPGKVRIPWNKIKVVRWINIDWRPAQNPNSVSPEGGIPQ
jgi:nitrous oxidase accessory protein